MGKTLILLVIALFLLSTVAFAFESADGLIGDFLENTNVGRENPVIKWLSSFFSFLKGSITGYVGYAGGGTNTSNLVVWDSGDANMPFANKTVYLDDPVTFFANFTNATNGQAIDNTKASVRA
ncbi:hypothetical protein KY308_03555, partial [Candidatus Woesearchaeota archaeon]|nr:hypothetical protein [Candidatus Woesearchaeota archaeon]